MANLLPTKELQSLKREQRRRLRTSVFNLISWLCVIGVVALLPTAFILMASQASLGQNLEATRKLVEREKEGHAGVNLASAKEKVDILTANAALTVPHELILHVTDLAPRGVAIGELSFIRDEESVTLMVGGSAADRASLVAFGDALKGSGLFTDVAIPIEALAQNTDLRFRLTLTLAEKASSSL